jgi:predicted esterase
VTRAARVVRLLAPLACFLLGAPRAGAAAGGVLSALPRAIDPHAEYLIYLHGRIVEEEGPRPTSPRFGTYEYRQILDALAARGFTVVSEVRPRGTDVAAYAGKVVGQVRSLLAAGVPPRRVAVVGFSKGGAIALVAASGLHHPDVRFVSLAGCGDWLFDRFKLDLAGRILSLYDAADDLATSCARAFTAAGKALEHREIVLHAGKGHGTFFRPDPAWLDPVTDWLAAER